MSLLENDKIYLRAVEPEDLDVLYQWENDSSIWEHGSTLTPFSKYVLREYIANSAQDIFQTRQLRLMIIEKTSQTPIGMVDLYDFDPINLRAGIGILLDCAYRQHGFGTQALQLVKDYASRILFLKQLHACVPLPNTPSFRLLQKCGFEPVGHLKAWIRTTEGFVDAYFMQTML